MIAGSLFGVPRQYNTELLAETARRHNQHTAKVVSSLSAIVLVVGLAAVLAVSSVGVLREGAHGTALYDTTLGNQIGLPLQADYPAMAIEFSADGHYLVAGDSNGGITVWDVRPAQGHYGDILSAITERTGMTISFDSGAITSAYQ